MSCGTSCPCQLSCMMDIQGSKRDPVSSEKAWLDFAVRCLSREAVCKGKGQEAVWSTKCKPLWWDSAVSLPWKNPTANPKDTKEVLMKKYDALMQHLRAEGRFPQELEEEAILWAEGKYKELFLQTSLSSLKGKVTGLHAAVMEISSKAKEMKAEVNQDLINDIKSCLGATLNEVENLTMKSRHRSRSLKRPFSETGNTIIENTSGKKCKLMDKIDVNLKQQPFSKVIPILPKLKEPVAPELDQSKKIVAQLQKVLIKRKNLSQLSMAATQKSNHSKVEKTSRLRPLCPKVIVPVSCLPTPSTIVQHNSSQPMNDVQSTVPILINGMGVDDLIDSLSDTAEGDQCNFNLEDIPVVHSSTSCSPEGAVGSESPLSSGYEFSSLFDENLEKSPQQSNILQSNSTSSEICEMDILHSALKEIPWSRLSDTVERDEGIESPENNLWVKENGISDMCNRINKGRTPRSSSCSSNITHESEIDDHLDSGCTSDVSIVDSILSPEEQNQIWNEDDVKIDFSLDLWDFVNDI